MSEIKTISELKYPGALPEFIEAYQLQAELEAREERLNKDKEKLKELLVKLSGIQDEIFSVTDMRMTRHIDTDWVKANMPKVYDALVHVTATDAGKIMATSFMSREKMNDHLRELNRSAFDTFATISTGDFERLVGKKEMKSLEGTAVRVHADATKKTKIIIKHPELLPQLPRTAELEEVYEE